MTEIIMDGCPLEVGNEVYCLLNGKGTVKEISVDGDDDFYIIVEFEPYEDYGRDEVLYYEGFKTGSAVSRTLYWCEPEIIPRKPANHTKMVVEKALASCEELEVLMNQQMETLKLMEKGVLQQIDKTRVKMKDLQHKRAKLNKLKGE